MRILITADLHYDLARSRAPAEALAQRACREGGDALVLVGDTAGASLDAWRQCLRLFASFPGRRLIVAGNHCLWCRDGEDSMQRYEQVLPNLAAEEGFELLDHAPVVLGGAALVGTVGWYDYTFAEPSLGIPEVFYRAKVSPGAAQYLGGYESVLDEHRSRLTEEHLAMGVRWMDGRHVRLGMSDEEFVDVLVRRLSEQLGEFAGEEVKRVIAFTHHLPFEELVPRGRPARFAFAAAYMGSEKFASALLACPKLTDVYCGHSHWPARTRRGGVNVVNIGSTYVEKRLEVLDVG